MNKQNLDDLSNIITGYEPQVRMAFMGGANHMASSDYRIVALLPYIEYPKTYHQIVHPARGHTIDLILHDPATLAFEIKKAKYTGNAKVLDIVANGEYLFGDKRKSNKLQKEMAHHLQKGPDKWPFNKFLDDVGFIDQQNKTSQSFNDRTKKLAAFGIAYGVVSLNLRAKCDWNTSDDENGIAWNQKEPLKKLVARLYEQENFEDMLAAATQDLQDPDLYDKQKTDFILETLKHEKDETIRHQFMLGYSKQYMQHVFKNGNDEQKKTAREFASNKLLYSVDALQPERFGQGSNEYFYALSRCVSLMARVHQAVEGVEDELLYNALDTKFPGFFEAVLKAEQGLPTDLQTIIKGYAYSLHKPDNLFITTTPSTFRAQSNFHLKY